MNTSVIANHLKVEESLILEVREWAKVFWVRVKGWRPRFVSKKIKKAMPIQITICDMRAAGKPGYVARIQDGQKAFLNSRKADSFTTSAKDVHYEISEDGIYEICDANFGERKRNIRFIKVESGNIVEESKSLSALQVAGIELPELTGSTKQVDWAEAIREKLIAKLKGKNKEIPDWVCLKTEANFWIDNRHLF